MEILDWLDAHGTPEAHIARDEIIALRRSVAFYKSRCDELYRWQSAMRDPERTLVCDVLANGDPLPPSHANGRYGSMTPNTRCQAPDAALGHIALMCYQQGAADAKETLTKQEEEK